MICFDFYGFVDGILNKRLIKYHFLWSISYIFFPPCQRILSTH
jgi:hypothetical protein